MMKWTQPHFFLASNTHWQQTAIPWSWLCNSSTSNHVWDSRRWWWWLWWSLWGCDPWSKVACAPMASSLLILEEALVGALACFLHPMMIIIIIISLKRITLCKSTIDDDYNTPRIEFHNRNPNFKLFHKRIETCKRKRWSQDAKTQLDKIYPFFYHCNNSNEQRCGALSLSLYRQSAFCFVLFFDPGRLWRDGMNNSRGDFFFFWVLACTQLAGNWFLVLSWIAKIFVRK